jgi:hypothetical protein
LNFGILPGGVEVILSPFGRLSFMLPNVFPVATSRQLPYSNPSSSKSPASLGSDVKLGWILVQKHWISASQLEVMLNQQSQSGQKLGELLLHHSLISTNQLTEALREQYWRRHGYWVI